MKDYYETFEEMLNDCDDIEQLRMIALENNRAAMAYEKAINRLDPETCAKVHAAAFNYLRADLITGMAEGEFKDFLRDLEMQRLRQRWGDGEK